MTSQVAI